MFLQTEEMAQVFNPEDKVRFEDVDLQEKYAKYTPPFVVERSEMRNPPGKSFDNPELQDEYVFLRDADGVIFPDDDVGIDASELIKK